ncbi:MAG: hypothetical protein H0U91_03120 [Rubrobacter sp.]|nr:hypothetical protein [Rubrobacter sp.]MBA3952404.1 hypothetical protein [Rubrobacter sp.]MDQ3362382.1 hypothetical protein [Actinomycetota bacterium]
MSERGAEPVSLGYQFAREEEARAAAADLDRRFDDRELTGLRIYRVRWNNDFMVEVTFPSGIPPSRIEDARALLGESGAPVHPDDLKDYKKATQEGPGGLPGWVRRLFGS